MKKLICLVLVVTLCMMTMGALAESTPSKTTGDLTHFTVTAENQPDNSQYYLLPVNEATMGERISEYQERIDIAQIEIDKLLATSETVEAYFGEVADEEGDVVVLKEQLETKEALNVFEFCPVIAGGFNDDYGVVTAKMLFSTPYEEGERVLVLVGFVTLNEDGTQTVNWREFEGVGIGTEGAGDEVIGRIQVEFDIQTVLAIQEGIALLAIISA